MIICGIKVTHDGGIALIENDQLKFSVEIEKIENNLRYSGLHHTNQIADILNRNGYNVDEVDRFVIDGWHGTDDNWKSNPKVFVESINETLALPVSGYNENSLSENNMDRQFFESGLKIGDKDYGYSSFRHVSGHVMGAYCSSPFAQRKENSYVLIWDGGLYPRLYYVDADKHTLVNKGHLFFLLGTAYGIIGQYFGPYKKTEKELLDEKQKMELEGFFGGYSVAGKIMSYIAKGNIKQELLDKLPEIHEQEFEISNLFEHKFCKAIKKETDGKGYSDADVLLTFHTYLQQLLIKKLADKINKDGLEQSNFCFAGGAALNIKWNSAIRESGIFKEVYVPPFPNDSGSAIGAAVCEMWSQTGNAALNWNVYSGPKIIENAPNEGWTSKKCSVQGLAELLYKEGEPVVVLNDRAEIGPRALGHRSILAPAVSSKMKEVLNYVKGREEFRPVAPICIEEEAHKIFSPGTQDPYMLFDHMVKEDWIDKVPAICHLDGTARLQTVSENQPFVFELLHEYKKLSNIPLLCNTSANHNGSGFFPDVKSVTEWGKVNYVWCEGILYSKTMKNQFEI